MFADFHRVNALATTNFKPQCDVSDPDFGKGPTHLAPTSLTSWFIHTPAPGIFCKNPLQYCKVISLQLKNNEKKMLMWTLENKAPVLLDQETKISLAFRGTARTSRIRGPISRAGMECAWYDLRRSVTLLRIKR